MRCTPAEDRTSRNSSRREGGYTLTVWVATLMWQIASFSESTATTFTVLFEGKNSTGSSERTTSPVPSSDPNTQRFAQAADRVAHRQQLTDEIERWMQSFPSDTAVLERLDLHRVPSSPVIDPSQARDDEHYRERGLVNTVHDPLVGEVDVPGFPLRFSNRSTGVAFETRTVGQDNAYVLGTLLGMDPSRIAELEEDGVIASRTS